MNDQDCGDDRDGNQETSMTARKPPETALAATLRQIEAEGESRAMRFQMKELRDFLAGALCTECGEPLGHDEEIIQDDDRTMHKRCEPKDKDDEKDSASLTAGRCTCGQSGHGNAHEPGCPLSSYRPISTQETVTEVCLNEKCPRGGLPVETVAPEPSAVINDAAGALLIIEEALGSVDGTEDAAGDVWDFPNAFAALKIIASCISALTAERDEWIIKAALHLERAKRAEAGEATWKSAHADATRLAELSEVRANTAEADLAKAREALEPFAKKAEDKDWRRVEATLVEVVMDQQCFDAALRALKAPQAGEVEK